MAQADLEAELISPSKNPLNLSWLKSVYRTVADIFARRRQFSRIWATEHFRTFPLRAENGHVNGLFFISRLCLKNKCGLANHNFHVDFPWRHEQDATSTVACLNLR